MECLYAGLSFETIGSGGGERERERIGLIFVRYHDDLDEPDAILNGT